MTLIKYGTRDIYENVNTINCNIRPDKRLRCQIGHRMEYIGGQVEKNPIMHEHLILDRVKIPSDYTFEMFRSIEIKPRISEGDLWDISIDIESNRDDDRAGPLTYYPYHCEVVDDKGIQDLICSSESL